ncbi:adenine phosphoribosyltransferase [Mycoplasma struthionis]|uniref:Adenine phosphoribosyltransferase n=1 Tax=Mycoplasma struthionis TaxID=538220 RepID=A0A502M4D8_9MOLU|nr:adenine phosphoribosyltransferase [Mycoplasma struthionis]TPI02822.1 adenine phosphoribosyltransferase [Mycoplasma struthionis]
MKLEDYIKTIKDFPKKGIDFKDISPLLANPEAFFLAIDLIAKETKDADVIIAPDARGFIFACPVAYKEKKPFIMVRKKGKIPGQTHFIEYSLEYGKNVLELQKGLIKKGSKVVIIDDVLATGGTLEAIIKLCENQEAKVIKIVVLLALKDLLTNEYVKNYPIKAIIES